METQMENLKEMFNKDLEDLKRKMKSSTVEMKSNLEGTNNRLLEAEGQINEVEERVV